MEHDRNLEIKKMSRDNAISVLKKMLVGTIVIMFVGVCAYISLIIVMMII